MDEPALWQKSLDDRIEHWIDVGQPDADRLIAGSRRGERCSLLVYGNNRVWAGRILPDVAQQRNLNIAVLPQEPLDALARDLPRNFDWSVMISEACSMSAMPIPSMSLFSTGYWGSVEPSCVLSPVSCPSSYPIWATCRLC